MSAEKGGALFDSYTTFVPMCMLDPSDSTHTKCWFFSRRIMVSAFNKLAIFLARHREEGSADSHRAPRPSGSPAWTRRKALLMRSLIRQIDECFVARSDVYPSRSATTRCVGRPPFTRDKKGLNFVGVPFSLTILGSFKCCFVLASRTDSSA